jgi:hypothetical protein
MNRPFLLSIGLTLLMASAANASQKLLARSIQDARTTAKSANWNHQFVDQSVKNALPEMDKMAKALSSEAK